MKTEYNSFEEYWEDYKVEKFVNETEEMLAFLEDIAYDAWNAKK